MIKKPSSSIILNPAKITLVYVVASLINIYFSDRFLRLFNFDVQHLSRIQTMKGAGFVLLSGGLLFLLVDHYSKEMLSYFNASTQERKKSFDALKQSEQKYWTVFNLSPLPMWIYDVTSLQFLLVNEAACNKYGYSKDEFYKMRISDIRPQEDMPRLFSALKLSRETKHKIWDEHFSHLCKNGSKLCVRIESAEITYENDIARLIVATDITEHVEADRLLAEANSRLKSASDIANLGYWSHNLRTSEVYWSETLFNIYELDKNVFKYTWDGMLNKINEEDRQHFTLEGVSKGETSEFEHRITTGKGKEKWMLERLSLLRDSEGTPLLLEGVVLDITERKHALQALENSNERFKMVAKAAVEAIIDWDVHTGDVYWGDGFAELFGYDLFTCGKTLWLRNIHPDDKQRVLARLANALSDRNTLYFFEDFRFRKANGQFAFVEHRGVFVRNDNGVVTRAIGAMIDVTVLKEKIIKIEEQNHELREIAWIQSHVVRAPLASLIGLTNMLKDCEIYQVDPGEVIPKIIESANKLDDVIRDIVSRTNAINKSTTVVN